MEFKGLRGTLAPRVGAAFVAALLTVSLAACASEIPEIPESVAGQGGKNPSSPSDESSWSEPTEAIDPDRKNTVLPESFPQDEFPLPAAAVVDDVGERHASAWFIVFRAENRAAADMLWTEVVSLGGFTESDVAEAEDGSRSATLSSEQLHVVAVLIPQPDGAVLLSYDLSRPTM